MSDTPRTDAETYVWEKGRENPFVHKEFAQQLERELNEKNNEVAKLNHQLLKTEYDLLESQDINGWFVRALKAEAEVARMRRLYWRQ